LKVFISSKISFPGGSTIAFINLTNALNEAGVDTTFYGPHDWHTKFCKGVQSTIVPVGKDDCLISHLSDFRSFRNRSDFAIRKMIYSCHEMNFLPMDRINYNVLDKVHFVTEKQKNYHNIKCPFFILPNILNDLKVNPKPLKKIGGVIGSIDKNKQTHLAIKEALKDGCKRVLVYGQFTDIDYYNNHIKVFRDNDKVEFKSFEIDKQKIYDSVTDVYHCSLSESWSYIKGECELTGTKFHGNNSTEAFWSLPKEKIVQRWIEEIEA
jgi:hypothetical protein